MKRNYIVIPTYNDWRSLNKLLNVLNKDLEKASYETNILVVNDCSLKKIDFKTKNLKNINSLKIINLKKNVGSQKAIFIGLKYLKKKLSKLSSSYIISVLDSDGEDNPKKLKELIKIAFKKKDFFVFAYRSERTENFFLKTINMVRLLISFILTGKYINFGNFSSFSSPILKKILSNNNLFHAFSSGVLKNYKKIYLHNVKKNKRYYGSSQVNYKFLIDHSINIVSIFYKTVFLRSLMLLAIFLFFIDIAEVKNSFLILVFFIFNIFIYLKFILLKPTRDPLILIKNISNIKI